jgi:exodeoxyribonuclease V gamma subunit
LHLQIISHPQLETLADDLAERLLLEPVADPFAPEWLLLPHGGMKSWLENHLAETIGVWSHAKVALPQDGLWELACLVLSDLPLPDLPLPDLPLPRLDYTESLWLIFRHLDSLLAEPALALLQNWLLRYAGASARMQLAQVMAEQLELLSLYRPALLREWSQAPDGSWAGLVWHFLCQTSGAGALHRAALQAEILQRLQSQQHADGQTGPLFAKGLPARLTLFAPTDLPPFYCELLVALATWIPTRLYLTQPLTTLPLLLERGAESVSLSAALPAPVLTLLQALQGHLRGEEPEQTSTPAQLARLASDSDSLQIHVTHGPLRELEVLHNYLLACFETLPDLLPGDIAVVIPTLESYAPLIEGVFYRPTGSAERLPFRIVPPDDFRSDAQLALRSLFELSGSRLSRDEVLAFLEQGSVARRFGFDAEALAQISQWLEAVEIRWGLDAEHRSQLDLPHFGENSWQQGLQRLLLGFALHDEGQPPFAGLLPYPAMEGHAVHLLGQLLDFFQTLEQAVKILRSPQAPERWAQILPHLAQRLLSPLPSDLEQWHVLLAQLANLQDLVGVAPEEISLGGVRTFLEKQWHQVSFRDIPTGLITFATPAQLWGVPFRVICFLGLNSGVLPRADHAHELDLLAEAPRLGDPSLRQADRQLFLETLFSARDRFYLSYTGRRVRDNLELPPSVLISELQDAVMACAKTVILKIPVLLHPLHPFASGYFQPQPNPARAYAQTAYEEALALQNQRLSPHLSAQVLPRPFVDRALPEIKTEGARLQSLDWSAFLAFFKHPSRAFLRQRLGLSLWQNAWQPVQNERFQLNALEIWRLREDYLNWLLQGQASEAFFERLKASNHLPLGLSGRQICQRIQAEVSPLAAQLSHLTGAPLAAENFVLQLGDWEIQGELAPLFEKGLIFTRLSGIKAADRLQIWLYHLLLGALGLSQTGAQTVTQIGLSKGQALHLSYTPVQEPAYLLEQYLKLYEQGLQKPLPVALESAWAFFEAREKGPEKARVAAENRWKGNYVFGGESENADYALCLSPDWVQTPEAEETLLRLYLPLQGYLQETPLAGLEALGL